MFTSVAADAAGKEARKIEFEMRFVSEDITTTHVWWGRTLWPWRMCWGWRNRWTPQNMSCELPCSETVPVVCCGYNAQRLHWLRNCHMTLLSMCTWHTCSSVWTVWQCCLSSRSDGCLCAVSSLSGLSPTHRQYPYILHKKYVSVMHWKALAVVTVPHCHSKTH